MPCPPAVLFPLSLSISIAAMSGTFLFTSESVNEGHPDKLCDQVCYFMYFELLGHCRGSLRLARPGFATGRGARCLHVYSLAVTLCSMRGS